MTLTSFGNELNVAIFGASGGIGASLSEQLSGDPSVNRVHRFARSTGDDYHFDFRDETTIERAIARITGTAPLDIVIVATGILHGEAIKPEKSLRQLSPAAMLEVVQVNTVGPALVAKHCLPHLRKDRKTVFAALSARVGSIGDNRLGGWISYRASKAALNMVLKTAAIEHARRWPESVVVGLHPGTVDTSLSAPFTGRVEPAKLFEPADSAAKLLRVIDGLRSDDTGQVFDWAGKLVEP